MYAKCAKKKMAAIKNKGHIDFIFHVHTLHEVFVVNLSPVLVTDNNADATEDNTRRTIYNCIGSLAIMQMANYFRQNKNYL